MSVANYSIPVLLLLFLIVCIVKHLDEFPRNSNR